MLILAPFDVNTKPCPLVVDFSSWDFKRVFLLQFFIARCCKRSHRLPRMAGVFGTMKMRLFPAASAAFLLFCTLVNECDVA